MDVIKIADEADINSMIVDTEYEDCLILGPAILASLEGGSVSGCTFDADPERLFLEVPIGKTMVGVVGLRNVDFRRCRFQNVGFVATEQQVLDYCKAFWIDDE